MINTHDSEVLVKNIVKIRLKNRDGRRKLVGKLKNLNIKNFKIFIYNFKYQR